MARCDVTVMGRMTQLLTVLAAGLLVPGGDGTDEAALGSFGEVPAMKFCNTQLNLSFSRCAANEVFQRAAHPFLLWLPPPAAAGSVYATAAHGAGWWEADHVCHSN